MRFPPFPVTARKDSLVRRYEPEAGYGSMMDAEAMRKARIADLRGEIDFIHFANELYWRQANPSDAARANYYRRQDRLEEIRNELAD